MKKKMLSSKKMDTKKIEEGGMDKKLVARREVEGSKKKMSYGGKLR